MAQIEAGDVVKDWRRDVVAVVEKVHGNELTLARPSGTNWPADARKCRPATREESAEYDRLTLALAKAKTQERTAKS